MVNGQSDFTTKFFGYMVILALWSTSSGQNRGPYIWCTSHIHWIEWQSLFRFPSTVTVTDRALVVLARWLDGLLSASFRLIASPFVRLPVPSFDSPRNDDGKAAATGGNHSSHAVGRPRPAREEIEFHAHHITYVKTAVVIFPVRRRLSDLLVHTGLG